jgi:hypothetical protein
MTQPRAAAPGADVFARTVPMIVERHSWGGHKKINPSRMGVIDRAEDGSKVVAERQPDSGAVSFTKKLLTSAALRAVTHRDSQFRDWLSDQATPFRPGFYLVPTGLVERVHAEATRWERERGELADRAAAAYPAHIEAMREPLGTLFNPLDYPRVDRFRAAFWVDWRFVDMGVPNVLRELRADLFMKEREKMERLGAEARSMVEQHLLGSLSEITEHLRDLLTPTQAGKKRAVRDGALDRLAEFLSTVEARNITGNEDLRAMSRRLRDLSAGLTVDLLRDDEQLRARTADAMTEIHAAVAGLVEDAPERAIRIRDEVLA